MAKEILSIAIFEPQTGREESFLDAVRELTAALARGGYCRDVFYHDLNSQNQFVLLRYWKSEEARRAALEDFEVLKCWSQIAQEIQTSKVYETLSETEL
ncbi:MAG TPA: antibiotic biosynthesis monooxygenase [Terriglobales bacterium]|jgi:quinol monooxygenase YgiN|nr:antibiotic biosynthesis monooxygenase [Terriglobales bacterium]